MRDVIFHAFNWKYQDIIKAVEDIHKAGYGSVLVPPPLYSNPEGKDWWQRYQPKDYRVLLSHLGGKKDLQQLIEKCHKFEPKVKVYADIVINHMANENRADRLNFPGEAELEKYRSQPDVYEENRLYGNLREGLFSPWDFNQAGNIQAHEWLERIRVIFGNLSDLPDLNDSPWVLLQQRKMFIALAKMGFDGFRIDAIKHLTERMIDNFADLDEIASKYLFGEVLTGSDRDEDIFIDPFLQETWISAYDFPLFGTIREAFSFGGSLRKLVRPEAEDNALPWHRAVTFVVNHDVPYNNGFRSWLLERQDEHLAYAYILGKDGGVPLIFSDHNESAEQHPEDKDRWTNIIERPDLVNMIRFHNAVHGQLMVILFESDTTLVFRRGNLGIVAINKGGTETWVEFSTWGLKNPGDYVDLIHGHQMKVEGNRFTLYIPLRTAQMWLAQ
ncbi:alpha-amylase family glycosyl hydrolase [Aliterella atlantica]|uniref:Alpha-amylase n=1 Tax=Aliterella atlantica CENA595 TaxID=1618023 RepID=A0A0D8ZL81_9CYAN|nr:alpha-amylase family glycosyl hydrolase [Aliterella atlantica]KJH69593.1 alpha-amylase [Aliterella atlantica CENA595]